MKVAIVHEMLIKLGGAERVLFELVKMFPDADIFTLMYDEKKVGAYFPKGKVWCNTPAQTQFALTGKPRLSLPLMVQSVEKIQTKGYDLVISSSSGFAHGVITSGDTKHICYCHSPARYLYDATDEIQAELGISRNDQGPMTNDQGRNFFQSLKASIGGPLVRGLFERLRKWDEKACKRPHLYIANSEEVRKRIEAYYHRDALVLWPPVEVSRFQVGSKPISQREYYIVTSALTPFKRVDRVVRVLAKLQMPVKIIGDGKEKDSLQKIAGKSIEILGRVSDEELVKLYLDARGFLMPQKEDAGIAPVEAMAAGIPVFGFGQGGLLETNIDGVTGRFYMKDTDESFEAGLLAFHKEIGEGKYDTPSLLIERAKEFDEVKFRETLLRYVEEKHGFRSEKFG